MSGNTLITALTTVFALFTLAAIVAVLYHFRRRPIIWLIGAGERRITGHRDALAALASAMNSARIEGRRGEFDKLAQSYRMHRAALDTLDPSATSGPEPVFDVAERAIDRAA